MKTTSNRLRYKAEVIEDTGRLRFRISIIELAIVALTIYIYYDLYNKTVFDIPSLNYFTRVFMAITIIGAVGGFIVNFIDAYMSMDKPDLGVALKMIAGSDHENEKSSKIEWSWRPSFGLKSFVVFCAGFGAVAAVQFGLKITQSVTNVDQFNFYVFAGVAEEMFFRYLITSCLYILAHRLTSAGLKDGTYIGGVPVSSSKKNLTWKGISVIVSIIISTLLTSTLFYQAHQTRYGDQQNVLVGIFLMSVILTIVYTYDKNVLTCILIHFLNNFVAFGSLLLTVS